MEKKITLKEAIERRDGDMFVINGNPIMFDDCIFTEDELNTTTDSIDKSFFTGINRVKYVEVVFETATGKKILFDIA